MHTPAQFAKKVGVVGKTIQNWDRLGIFPAKRASSNRRYYTEEDLAAALRLPRIQQERKTIAYCRVSRQAQKPALLNQRQMLEQWCEQLPSTYEVVPKRQGRENKKMISRK